VSQREESENVLRPPNVLIVSDDTEFARRVITRWQMERFVPEITFVTTDIWRSAGDLGWSLAIFGFVHGNQSQSILSSLCAASAKPVIFVTEVESDIRYLPSAHPQLLILQQNEELTNTLVLLAAETLRRVEALGRAHRAERIALESQNHATLGRYMLDMRPSINNALTSVLGNADLLLEPGQAMKDTREQIRTVHTMALRLNEIMQRFSSLDSEMRAGENDSHAETPNAILDLTSKS
jgi:hypothetical protein